MRFRPFYVDYSNELFLGKDKIEKAEQNRVVMEEEKQSMEGDLVKWKEEFVQQNQREPEEADK